MSKASKKTILLINGGGGSEHDISLISSAYLQECLEKDGRFTVLDMTIEKNGERTNKAGERLELRRAGELYNKTLDQTQEIDFFIPCIHGPPGETGEIQAIFEMMGKPYLGVRPEGNMICFNKVTTKLWLDALEIPNAPWTFLSSPTEIEKAQHFFKEHQDIFIKAASQGSSIGCYHCVKENDLGPYLEQAARFSPYILLEKTLKGRELEMSFYEINGQLHHAGPGEIICPDGFYDYQEKYSQDSRTQTNPKAQVAPEVYKEMVRLGNKAFRGLKLRHLSRIDFFLTSQGKVYINEINTFPGMTPISLFPKMIEATGQSFQEVIMAIIAQELNL